MSSSDLTAFQINLVTAESQLNQIRDGLDAVNDIGRNTARTLKAVGKIKDAIALTDNIVDTLDLALAVVGKIGPLSTPAKAFRKIIKQVDKSIEVLAEDIDTLFDRADTIRKYLEKVTTAVNIIELDLKVSELVLEDTRDRVALAQTALTKLESAPLDGDPDDITAIQESLALTVAEGNQFLIGLIAATDGPVQKLSETLDLLRPPGFDFDVLDRVGDQFGGIVDALDGIAEPLEALRTVAEPIESILDAVDAVYDFFVAPVVDPILEATGLQSLLDEVADKVLGLLPDISVLDPLTRVLDDFNDFVASLDFSLPDPAFADDLSAFLGTLTLTNGFVASSAGADQGFPFEYRIFGLDPQNEAFWTRYNGTGTFQAAETGGFVFGNLFAQEIVGGIGSDLIFGGGGNDVLTHDGVDELADSVNLIIGGGGDDRITAYGNTTVYYLNGIGEYLITQGTETVGGEVLQFADIAHLPQVGDGGADGTDRVYYDSDTKIAFATLPILNMEIFLRGYQAASADNPDLFGDRDDAGNAGQVPLRDFLIGNTSDAPGSGVVDQANLLVGYKLDDFLSGGDGDDDLKGGEGNDYLVGGDGTDTLDGGPGIDTASFVDLSAPIVITDVTGARFPFGSDATRGAQLFLDKTAAEANDLGLYLTDAVTNVENVIGSRFEEIVFGNRFVDNILLGEDGGDVLRGVGSGAEGNQVDGGAGKDAIIIDSGRDRAFGGDDDDVFYVALDAQHMDAGNFIDGGAGNDLINYAAYEELGIFGSMNPRHAEVIFTGIDFGPGLDLNQTMAGGSITVNGGLGTVLRIVDATGATSVDRYTNVEAIVGTVGGDTFIAAESETPVEFHGGDGADTFVGVGWGIDVEGNRDVSADGNALFGGNGDDTFRLFGSHEVHGGAGLDTIDLSEAEGFWTLDLTGLEWRAGSQVPVLEHFDTEADLPDTRDLFVRPGQILNADPLPPWFDDSDPRNDPRPDFVGPLDDGQLVSGIEIVIGTARRDVILGGREILEIQGGAGDDYLALRFDSDPQAITFDEPYPVQVLDGGAGDDHLVGHFGAEFLYGGDGNDIIDLVANVFDEGEISYAYGGDGADLFFALDYEPDRQFPGEQQIYGGEHVFEVTLQDGTIVEREYQDAVDFGDGEVSQLNPIQRDGVRVYLSYDTGRASDFQARGIKLFEIENVFGTRYNDDIYGDEFDNVLIGRAGDDDLYGEGGDDILIAGTGDDNLYGGAGDDIFLVGYGDGDIFNGGTDVFGGAGRDTLSFQFLRPDGRGSTTIDPESIGRAIVRLDQRLDGTGGRGEARFIPDDDEDIADDAADRDRDLPDSLTEIYFENGVSQVENVTGGRGDDEIWGDGQDNVLVGDAGDDLIRGQDGNDAILVGSGDDDADAGAGDDTVYGDVGNNILDGGAGDGDRLDFSANTQGLRFDLDAQTLEADYHFSVRVYADQADTGGTLADRAAVTKQVGNNIPGQALGMTAEDIFKIENPSFADRYFHLDPAFVRSVLGADGLALASYAFVEQSEVRTYTNTLANFEAFVAGSGDDIFTYTAGTGFAGLLDGGDGTDTLDLSGITQAVGFELVGDVFRLVLDAIPQTLQVKNIERVLTAAGEVVFNTDPNAEDDVATTDKATAITIDDALDNDTDGNPGDVLSVVGIDTTGTRGRVTDNGDGTFTYDPDGQFEDVEAGRTATDRFTYTISDGNGGTDTATVIVNVRGGVEAAPLVAVDDTGIAGTEDTVVVIDPATLLANDTGDARLGAVGDAVNGAVAVNGAGAIEFTPDANVTGAASFVYTIVDDAGQTAQATVTLDLAAVNDAPVLVNGLVDRSVAEDTAVGFTIPADTFADVDGDALTLSATLADGSPLPGWLAFDPATGRFSGQPPADFNGVLAIALVASDGALTASDGFDLTITPVNDAPTAGDDVVAVVGNQSTTLAAASLLGNDGDVDGDDLAILDVTQPQSGTVSIEVDGSLTYAPADGFVGADSFTYTVSDGALDATATVAVTVLDPFAGYAVQGTEGRDFLFRSYYSPNEIYGRGGNDVIFGGREDDRLAGGEGRDYILGGRGDDLIDGGAGRDFVRGGSGNDTIHGRDGNDRIFASRGDDAVFGGAGNDWVLAGSGNDIVDGGSGADRLDGGSGRDVLSGAEGNDRLSGGSGNDTLDGGEGNDRVFGNAGDDLFLFSAGSDRLLGGSGFDTADFDGALADFSVVRFGSGNWQVTHNPTGDVDTLNSIARLTFDDGDLFA